MSNINAMTIAALKVLDPNRAWELILDNEDQAQNILRQMETARAWVEKDEHEEWEERIQELLADNGITTPTDKPTDTEADTEAEADTPADDGPKEEDDMPTPEFSPQENPQPDHFDLARYIVTTARANRDQILDGIDLGKSGSTTTIKIPDRPEIKFDKAHYMLPTLIKAVATGNAVMLVGPPGSGKTTAGAQVAEVFGVPFYANSNSRMDTRTLAFGYMDGGGSYRSGYLYEPMKNGGVLLDDEVDASNENVMVSKNTAIENRFAYFPNGERVDAGDNFYYIGSANTYGRGADRMFVGRTQLDAATIDRFVMIEWNYDEDLERMLTGNDEWCEFVQSVRSVVQSHGMRYIVSPRASIKGAHLLAADIPEEQVRKMVLFKGWPTEDVDKVMREIA